MNTPTHNTHTETASQPTPGPWIVTAQFFSKETRFLDGWCETVRLGGPCDAIICSLGADRNEQRANARLIAAAPDLLAALESCQMALYGYLPHSNEVTRNALDKARAAIARARGTQQGGAK